MSFASIFQGHLLEADSEEADSMSGLGKCSRSQLSSPCHNYYSDEDLDLYPPSGKRLAPVGAASNEDEPMASSSPRTMMSLNTRYGFIKNVNNNNFWFIFGAKLYQND